ncbi:MAG: hypothetical protein RRC07_12395 [Anaerolineae bacterium]|nr:hypothetical protein [Anaerolineae bacterium]
MPTRPDAVNRTSLLALMLVLLVFAGAGCGPPPGPQPTSAAAAIVAVTETAAAALQPTWTRPAAPPPANTPVHSLVVTPRPTRTPLVLPPTETRTRVATATITPTETTTPAPGPIASVEPPPGEPNLLPNPSFEEGWYHPYGIDELQVPNRWALEWLEGANHLDPDPWNAWVRPEVRILSPEFLPAAEHSLFIWEGQQTLKVFKGAGAISFNLQTSVYLEPGGYLFVVHVFPDLVDAYGDNGQKVWAPDPLSGEVALIVAGEQQPWQLPRFGQKNRFTHLFVTENAGLVQLGVAVRGRWAITNNGWFLDDWALYPVPPDSG